MHGHHASMKIPCGTTMRGEDGVAGEGKLVGVPKLNSWAMPLMNSPTLSLSLLY